MRSSRKSWLIAALVLCASACASTASQLDRSVTGTVVLPPNTEIPDGAVVHVKLIDQTDGGREVAAQSIERPNAFPVEFKVDYNPSEVTPAHSYAIEARVEVWGSTKYRSTKPVPVLTGGNPSTARVQTEAAS